MLDMGPYYLTALVQLFGPVKTVSAFGRRAQDRRVIGSGPRAGEAFDVEVDSQVSALLEFGSGPIATAGSALTSPSRRELEIHGTDGAVRCRIPIGSMAPFCFARTDRQKNAQRLVGISDRVRLDRTSRRGQRGRARDGGLGHGSRSALRRHASGRSRPGDARAGYHGIHRAISCLEPDDRALDELRSRGTASGKLGSAAKVNLNPPRIRRISDSI